MRRGSLVENAHPYGRQDYEDASLDDGLVGDHHRTCKPEPALSDILLSKHSIRVLY